jgi:hypothetical protein
MNMKQMNTKHIFLCAFVAAFLLSSCASNSKESAAAASDQPYNIVVSGNYPTIDGEEALSAIIKNRAVEIFKAFEDEITQNETAAKKAGAQGLPTDFPVTFDISYKAGRHDTQLCSIIINTQWFSGGAHGAELVESYLWDVKAKKMLALKDVLILAGFSSLQELALRAQNDLEEKINREKNADISKMIKEGTKPVESNFKVFLLESGTLTFYFQRYQVAPGALGVQQLKFPVKQAR